MNQITTVIFDMDGLLIDTEGPAKLAWQRAANEIGESIEDEMMLSLVGLHINDCLDILSDHFGRDLRECGFMEKVDDIYFSNFIRNGIDVKHGAEFLLSSLVEKGIPRAVATSSEQEIAPRKLRLAGLDHYFDLVVSGCEVEKSKPEPDIFLLTAEKMGVNPDECIVLEDSYNGVRAAHRAGMHPIMIPDLLQPTEEMKEMTIAIFSNLEQARPHVLGLLGS